MQPQATEPLSKSIHLKDYNETNTKDSAFVHYNQINFSLLPASIKMTLGMIRCLI